MVNPRNISAGESRLRVQRAYLSLYEIKHHLNHFDYYVDPTWVLEHSHYSQRLFPKVL